MTVLLHEGDLLANPRPTRESIPLMAQVMGQHALQSDQRAHSRDAGDIYQEPATRELATTMMREAQVVAEKLGVSFRVPLEKPIEGAAKVGKHKTSTL